MLTFLDDGVSLCDRVNRREWLRVGSLGVGGLSLAHLLAAKNSASGDRHEQGTGCRIRQSEVGDPVLADRRSASARDVGHEAGRSARDSWFVWPDRVEDSRLVRRRVDAEDRDAHRQDFRAASGCHRR